MGIVVPLVTVCELLLEKLGINFLLSILIFEFQFSVIRRRRRHLSGNRVNKGDNTELQGQENYSKNVFIKKFLVSQTYVVVGGIYNEFK